MQKHEIIVHSTYECPYCFRVYTAKEECESCLSECFDLIEAVGFTVGDLVYFRQRPADGNYRVKRMAVVRKKSGFKRAKINKIVECLLDSVLETPPSSKIVECGYLQKVISWVGDSKC